MDEAVEDGQHMRSMRDCAPGLFGLEGAPLLENARTIYSTCQRRVKEEDAVLVREGLTHGVGGTVWSLYGICDGHGGAVAANYVTGNVWRVLRPRLPTAPAQNCSAQDVDVFAREVRAAVAAAFKSIGAQFERDVSADTSGTSLTLALLCGRLLTVANVGNSDAVLDTGSDAILATAAKRSDDDGDAEDAPGTETCAAVDLAKAKGSDEQQEIGQGFVNGQQESQSPLWSIGDVNAGKPVCHCPHVFQALVPMNGVRMIIGSAGLWDLVHWEQAARMACQAPIATCAAKMVSEAEMDIQGPLKDDVTALVVDIMPPLCNGCPMKKWGSRFGLQRHHWLACRILGCVTNPGAVAGALIDRKLRVIASVDAHDIDQDSRGTCLHSSAALESTLHTPTKPFGTSTLGDMAFMLAQEIALCRPLTPFRKSLQGNMAIVAAPSLQAGSSLGLTAWPVDAPRGSYDQSMWSHCMPKKSQYAARESDDLPWWSAGRPGELSANYTRGSAPHVRAVSCGDPRPFSLDCSPRSQHSCAEDMAVSSRRICANREVLLSNATTYSSPPLSIRTTIARGRTYGCGLYQEPRARCPAKGNLAGRRSFHERQFPSDQGMPTLKEPCSEPAALPLGQPDQVTGPFRTRLDDRLEAARERWWRGGQLDRSALTFEASLPSVSSCHSRAAGAVVTKGLHHDAELLELMYGSRSEDEASFSGWTPRDSEVSQD